MYYEDYFKKQEGVEYWAIFARSALMAICYDRDGAVGMVRALEKKYPGVYFSAIQHSGKPIEIPPQYESMESMIKSVLSGE